MSSEAVLPDLEPENRSGIPEGREFPSITVLGAPPGTCWYQPTLRAPTLLLSPLQVSLTFSPGDPDSEASCVSPACTPDPETEDADTDREAGVTLTACAQEEGTVCPGVPPPTLAPLPSASHLSCEQ